jgi:HEPN domain-containing protein
MANLKRANERFRKALNFLDAAEALFEKGLYNLASVMCHQALEFNVVSLYYTYCPKKPPKIHTTVKLLEFIHNKTNIAKLTEDQLDFFNNTDIRYSTARYSPAVKISKTDYLAIWARTKEEFIWLSTLRPPGKS